MKREKEARRILQNLALSARISAGVLSPLLVAGEDPYVVEMYKNALKKGFISSRVIEIDASTLSLQDFVPSKENIFLYVTGSFCDEDIASLGKNIDEYKIGVGNPHENVAPIPSDFGCRPASVHIKNADFTMVRFTFDMDMKKLSVPVTDLIYDILLSGYNSKFFIEMSERRGLFYDISGATERYKNIGTFTFSFEVRPDAVYEAIATTFSILGKLKRDLLEDDECMKAGYVDNAFMLYDDTRELNFTFAYDNHVMNNGYSSLADRAERYRKVTPDRLREVTREIFAAKNLTLTVKGNKKKIDTEKILRIIDKFE